MQTIATNHHGLVVETTLIPAGFLRRIEAEGLAVMTARTDEGVYLEPRVPLHQLLARFELAGVAILAVRQCRELGAWRNPARPAPEASRRLRSSRTAEWLPTLPAA